MEEAGEMDQWLRMVSSVYGKASQLPVSLAAGDPTPLFSWATHPGTHTHIFKRYGVLNLRGHFASATAFHYIENYHKFKMGFEPDT